MRLKFETEAQKAKRLGKIHKWFAWYPVAINGELFWLEYVYRMFTMKEYGNAYDRDSFLVASYYPIDKKQESKQA